MNSLDYVIFSSYGNDSIALIQWAKEEGLENVSVVYTDTGWGAENWRERTKRGAAWVKGLGYKPYTVATPGMSEIVIQQAYFPNSARRFCTRMLKQEPARRWLERTDPEKDAVCLVGVRREESASRASFPEWQEESRNHGGRALWAPLVRYTEADRDELIRKAGWEVLPHRSRECHPCIFARKSELGELSERDIQKVEKLEHIVSHIRGSDCFMFNPSPRQNAAGIRQVVDWGQTGRGEYRPPAGCDSGFCYEV